MSTYLGSRLAQRLSSRFAQQYGNSATTTAAAAARQRSMQVSKRLSSTSASAAAKESFWKRTWKSPVGVRTVHFWAPMMKWMLVLAGLSEFARPPELLSVPQNAALACTGVIWTRWCLIIRPRNILLATVNFFVGCVGLTQLSRIGFYRWNLQKDTEQSQAQQPESGPEPEKNAAT